MQNAGLGNPPVQDWGADEPNAPVRADCDGLRHSATACKRDVERCATESSSLERHGIGSSPAQPSEAMHRLAVVRSMLPTLKLSLDGFELRNHPLLRRNPPDDEGSCR